MSLLKKTIVLSGGGKPKGYVTIVRVGNEAGAKVVGDAFTTGMRAYLGIGSDVQRFPLTGKRTEWEWEGKPGVNDSVSCVVYGSGAIVAKGGKELPPKVTEHLLKEDAESVQKDEESVQKDAENLQSEESEAQEETHADTPDPAPERRQETEERIPEETPEDAPDEGGTEKEEREEREDEEGKKKELTEEEDLLGRLGQGTEGYYLGIRDKVDELFVVYPQERALEELIPDSEWVKVEYEKGEYYVVGRLSENGKVRYLGYGVPGVETIRPPKVASGIANWFPVRLPGDFDGYWLFFQDAETGKIER